jgi:type IV secretion system protein VirB9
MILRSVLALAFTFVVAGQAGAKVKPVPSSNDPHFQSIPYVNDVVEIVIRPGRFAEIQLSPGETDIKYAMGDSKAWTVKTAGNVFAFKPKAATAETNLKIWSSNSNRVYWFNIVMAKKDDTAELWHLDVVYPPDPPRAAPPVNPEVVAIQLAAQEADSVERHLGGASSAASEVVTPEAREQVINGNYGIIGPDELTPTSVYDNGERTVLTFAPNNPLPDIFVKEADGSETRVSKHIENDMLIVHRVARKFTLRHNGQAACLINGSFNATGANSRTNTVSDHVMRETRKAN